MASRDRREKRKSAARRRAEQHVSGFETTCLRVPEGLGFYDLKVGLHRVDIVPFEAKEGNPFADPGELYYERTFYVYRKIGIEEKNYICPSKTFGKPDYIQEHRQRLAKDPDADTELVKALSPKERQIFLVYGGPRNTDPTLALLEASYHLFGKLLDSRIKNSTEEDGWDMFYFPDEDGMTLQITVEENSSGKFKFNEVTAIDFLPRSKPLPKEIRDHGYCLDDFLVEVEYDKLKDIFLGVTDGEDRKSKREDDDEEEEEERRETSRPAATEDTDAPASVGEHVEFEYRDETIQGEVVEVDDENELLKVKSKKREKPHVLSFDDDTIRVIAAPKKEKATKPKKKTAPAVKKGDTVIYKKMTCSVLRVGDDGTLTLMDDEDEDLYKGVTADEVALLDEDAEEAPPEKSPTKSASAAKAAGQPKKAAASTVEKKSRSKKEEPTDEDGGDDDWDKGWDD